jgi:hypothetical protein
MKRKLARGIVDRIGGPASFRFEAMGSIAAEKTLSVANHEQTLRLVIEWINSRADLQPITGVKAPGRAWQ